MEVGLSRGPTAARVQCSILLFGVVFFSLAMDLRSCTGASTTESAVVCPLGCRCAGRATGCVATDNSTVPLETVPPFVQPGADTLIIIGQNITRVHRGDFRDPSYQSLRWLLFLNCTLHVVEGGAFTGLGNVTTLQFHNSSISSMDEHTFEGLEKVESLLLVENEQLVMQPCAFSGLPKLKDLSLVRNPGINLTIDLFAGEGCDNGTFPQLETLSLTDQPIGMASQDWQILPSIRRLNVRKLPTSLLNTRFIADITNLGVLLLETEVSHFPRNFFRNGNLHSITITGSSISELPANAFADTPNLQYLDIVRSRLASIHPEALSSLVEFRRLRLSGTDVRTLPSELFSSRDGRISLGLDLEGNQLETLPEGLLHNQTGVYMLKLGGNPWICDCSLHWVIVSMRQNRRIIYSTETACAAPVNLVNVTFSELVNDRDNVTGCEPPTTTVPTTTRVITTTPTRGLHSPTTKDPNGRDRPQGTSRPIGSYWYLFVTVGLTLLTVCCKCCAKCCELFAEDGEGEPPAGDGATEDNGEAASEKGGLRDIYTPVDSSNALMAEKSV